MASINSVGSSSSSIYGTRNVISGLASGMDTESLIENAVAGYKTKITGLQQKRTKIEWQQEAYRSIITKMAAFSDKYTSYASSTNLMSSSFFNQAVKVSTSGKYADLVSASGRTSSSVQILGVKQLAQAASYTVSGIGGNAGGDPKLSGESVDLSKTQALSTISGSLTINYGGSRSFSVDFGELDIYKNAEEVAAAIEEKLGEQTMTLTDGTTVAANARIGVRTNGDTIEFYDKMNAGNSVYISDASGDIKSTLGINASAKSSSLNLTGKTLSNDDATLGDYLSKGKTLQVTLDGVTKKIELPAYRKEDGTALTNDEYLSQLQTKLDDAFGAGKITVSKTDGADNAFSLNMATQRGSTMSVAGDAAKALGLDKASTYVNTAKTLGELLGDNVNWDSFTRAKAEGEVREVKGSNGSTYLADSKGNRVAKDGDSYYRVDEKGKFLYEFKINDKVVGSFSENSALESVITAINSNADAGVQVSYSKTTNKFQFTAKESGAASRVDMGTEGLAYELFGKGGSKTEGRDAIFSMSVNGQKLDGIKRSSNTFDVDGMSLNLKGTFGEYADGTDQLSDWDAAVTDAVGFTSSSDSDKIVDAIKAMIEDYNAMATEIKNAYSTLPAQKSNGTYYQPLTDDDKDGMSESTIASYEEKAKQGILFGDNELASLYSRLTNAISLTGKDGADLKSIGITVSYSNGLTTLSLNETALRSALDTDPDKVRDVFTKSKDSGSSTNGLMQSLKTPLDMYGQVSGTKGILVEKAGSPLAATTLYKNTLQTRMDEIDTQIEKWQDKMSDQIDRYTSKFSALEQMIAQMNSQSSMLSGLMGY